MTFQTADISLTSTVTKWIDVVHQNLSTVRTKVTVSLLMLLILCSCTFFRQDPTEITNNRPSGNNFQSGEVMGSGQVRISMLLPLSATGAVGETGQAFKNAARMAFADSAGADIQLAFKDTGATYEGARQAAREAISDGSQVILGPIVSQAVTGAAEIARVSGIPVIAYSSDVTKADSGVYLFSFLPHEDVNRIVNYSASQNKKSFIAILPDSTYGAVIEAAFRQAVSKVEGRIVTITRYNIDPVQGPNANEIATKVSEIVTAAEQADVVLFPEGGSVGAFIAESLEGYGVKKSQVQFLGSGQWNSDDMLNNQTLSGSWFPSPDNSNYEDFALRYQQVYGVEPQRNVTLAYDSVRLVAGLVYQSGSNAFNKRNLTNPSGFLGVDGVFRFKSDGQIERGLAVFEATGNGSRIISPAPRSFSTTAN